MSLIHNSGFIDNMDDLFNRKFKLCHLPYPVRCSVCGTFWLSLLYIIIAKEVTLFNLMVCLAFATLTNVIRPLLTVIENYLLYVVEQLNNLLD